MEHPGTVAGLTETLRQGGYLADRGLATALLLALSLQRPVLLEGEVGVGKTEVAKVLAAVLDRKLIRLQCYEGIDTHQALYEWDYARQMLQIRALSAQQAAGDDAVDKLFGPRFLLERPLLEAVRLGDRAVLLIDEIDRADDEFEAFLLELLSDFQISIPEIGTITAARPPAVVLTSNRTRELHDALKRAGCGQTARSCEHPGETSPVAVPDQARHLRLPGTATEAALGMAGAAQWAISARTLGRAGCHARLSCDHPRGAGAGFRTWRRA